jgi:hypothetical protein
MDEDLVFGDAAPVAKKATKKPAVRKVKAEVIDHTPVKDDAKSQKGWPIVWIDAVEGMPNYEVVGLNGEVYKIMREVEVPVPHAVAEILRHAVAERLVQTHNPAGGITTKMQKYSTIPWRVVGYVQ